MEGISLQTWQIISAVSLAFSLGILGLWLINRVQARRKRAGELADVLRSWGLSFIATLLDDYSHGDYSEVISGCIQLAKTFRSPGGAVALLEGCFWKILDAWKQNPAKLAEIRKRLDQLVDTTTAPPA